MKTMRLRKPKILTLQGELLKLHLPFYAQDKGSTRRNVVPINN